MHLDTKESRQAHTETGSRDYVAASSPSPSASSPAQGTRDPQPASCRGGDAGQPFPLGGVVGMPHRSRRQVPPIPAEILRRIYDEDRAFNRGAVARASSSAPTWTDIAIAAVSVAALVMFLFFLDGGWIVR